MSKQADPTLGWAAISWIEHYMVHGPGDVQGQRIELDDEFAAFVVKAYRVDPKKGEKRVRRAFLSRAKGRSKSGLAAMIECFEALGPCRFDHFAEEGEVSDWGYEYQPGEPVGRPLAYVEILNVATEEGQAGNTYDAVYYMLNPETCAPELLTDYSHIDVGLTRIILPNSRGFIEPVTSADGSKDGGKSTFIVADETHLWILPRLHRLHGIMTRNLLKRKAASGWMLETSTMYAEGENSVAEGTHAYAESSVRSRSTLLFDHRQAAHHWDLNDPKQRISALREAYGPAAEWMNLEAIADSWDDPQVSEADFRRFWLNQPVPLVKPPDSVMPNWTVLASAEPWIPQAVAIALDPDRVWASVGIAAVTDGVPHVDLKRREKYGDWAIELADELHQLHQCLVVVDRKGPASDLVDDLEAKGIEVMAFGLEEYVTACADLFDSVERLELRHRNDDDLNAAVQAAGWRRVGDRRVWSRRSGAIDALESATLALWAATQPVEETNPSAYFV